MQDNNFKLKIITPERVFYEGEVHMIEFNATEGEVGIYKNHIPMTLIIRPGILTIYEEERARNAVLHAGFAEILQDKVTILAEIIEWPEEIDRQRAEAAKKEGRRKNSIQNPRNRFASGGNSTSKSYSQNTCITLDRKSKNGKMHMIT